MSDAESSAPTAAIARLATTTTAAQRRREPGSLRTVFAHSLGPRREVRQLVLRLAGQQVDEAALDALALEQRVVDLLGDRQLHVVATRERDRRVDGVSALGDAGQRRLE